MSKGRKGRDLTPHERMHWRFKVQRNQVGQVRFVIFLQRREVSPQKFMRYSTYREQTGLQVENRFYFVKNGVLQYCYINRVGCKITYVYDSIPRFAEPELRALYAKKKAEFESATTPTK